MTDLNSVTAGEYELVAALFDQVTSKPGEPLDYKRYRAGDVVSLDVEDARRLVAAGAVVEPGARQRAAYEAAKAAAEAALAALPAEVREQIVSGEATQVGTVGAEAVVSEPPTKSANKDEWVSYAVAHGLTEAEAKKLKKDELIARLTVGDNDGGSGHSGDDPGSDSDGETGDDSGQGDGSEQGNALPLLTAPHEAWVDAAVEREIPRDEAEAMSVQELHDLLT